ncbi:MAG: hypothetical protein JNM77_11410 [Pseudonocardia sp.]|nr:hypothetical protein [Pseudonocardia sp.]
MKTPPGGAKNAGTGDLITPGTPDAVRVLQHCGLARLRVLVAAGGAR